MKSKDQQIAFFKNCLVPQYDIAQDKIDFKAYVDSNLTTRENWQNIKDQYGLNNDMTGELQFMEQKVKHLAQRVENLELELQELKQTA
ncbi:MAG: hypothetical protein ACI8Z7_000201 [Candidatus Nanohaloarchaea archaeon]|jgi:hypothetical protein